MFSYFCRVTEIKLLFNTFKRDQFYLTYYYCKLLDYKMFICLFCIAIGLKIFRHFFVQTEKTENKLVVNFILKM